MMCVGEDAGVRSIVFSPPGWLEPAMKGTYFGCSCALQLHDVLESVVAKCTIIHFREAKSLLARASAPSAGHVIAVWHQLHTCTY